jgi:uncharacterized protein (DUF433 family)
MSVKGAEEYQSFTDVELAEWEAGARGGRGWTGDDVMRLIAEVRRWQRLAERPVIVRDPRRCAGDPTIEGTRIAVHDVISYARHYGGDLERVRQEALPDLTLLQLQAAIEYYEQHREEIEDILRQRREEYERAPLAPMRR